VNPAVQYPGLGPDDADDRDDDERRRDVRGPASAPPSLDCDPEAGGGIEAAQHGDDAEPDLSPRQAFEGEVGEDGDEQEALEQERGRWSQQRHHNQPR